MELISFAKQVAQNVAEYAASYRLGQSALRQLDRALWVVEKCARWAVPPPLDQDDHPQPELVRPLPWVFFLAMLVTLRLARETASVANLVFGKPPLRSADVVMYIQSKRRYIRTLKYQGSKALRARATRPEPSHLPSGKLQALLDMVFCFRRPVLAYGNNNSTRVSNNDEVLVVKHGKRPQSPSASSTASGAMERLIERMMVDMDAESDDDSSFTLTNAPSLRSDSGSDTLENHTFNLTRSSDELNTELELSNSSNVSSSTPNNSDVASPAPVKPDDATTPNKNDVGTSNENDIVSSTSEKSVTNSSPEKQKKIELSEPNFEHTNKKENLTPKKDVAKEETQSFLQNERCTPKTQSSPKSSKIGRKLALAFTKTSKKSERIEMANGRTVSSNNKRKGIQTQRRDEVITTNVEGQL